MASRALVLNSSKLRFKDFILIFFVNHANKFLIDEELVLLFSGYSDLLIEKWIIFWLVIQAFWVWNRGDFTVEGSRKHCDLAEYE